MSFKYIPLSGEDKKIFCADALRKKYWKRYCDGLCKHISDSEIKKYDDMHISDYESWFFNLHQFGTIKNSKDWIFALLKVDFDDLERFRSICEVFNSLKVKDNATIPMLFAVCKMQKSIIEKLYHDLHILSFIHPREHFFNYEDFRIEIEYPDHITRIDEMNDIEKVLLAINLEEYKNFDLIDNIKKYKEGKYTYIYDIGSELVRSIIADYNFTLTFLNEVERVYTKQIDAFISNLFAWLFYPLNELDRIYKENPASKSFSILQNLRDNEIKSFKESVLGKQWCICIKDDNVEAFSRYMLNHRDTISEEEEIGFFRQFNKICMIEDILEGKAEKYQLKVDYSKINNGNPCTADAEDKVQENSPFSALMTKPELTDDVLRLLHEFMKNKQNPKDIVMPIRAAIEAGVIKRPSWDQFQQEFGDDRIKCKSSFSDYTNPAQTPYNDNSFNVMKKLFEDLLKK